MKNKIAKERVIFDNYETWKNYTDEEIIESLVENGIDEDEITDPMIWEERDFYIQNDWENAKEQLAEFFLNGNKWMIFGEIARWNGTYKAGMVFDTFEDFFYRAASDCDYWKFYDENGHLYLTCSHHDGTCHYEIKELTDKGQQYLDNWEYGNDKRTEEYVHTQIFNKYSRLPRFAENVLGCKRFEYEPVTKENLINKLNNQAKSFYC